MGGHVTPEELAAIRERDEAGSPGWALSDRAALLDEVDRLRDRLLGARHSLATMAAAERTAMQGASRAERVGHKAAAEAYSIAIALLDGEVIR